MFIINYVLIKALDPKGIEGEEDIFTYKNKCLPCHVGNSIPKVALA